MSVIPVAPLTASFGETSVQFDGQPGLLGDRSGGVDRLPFLARDDDVGMYPKLVRQALGSSTSRSGERPGRRLGVGRDGGCCMTDEDEMHAGRVRIPS